MFFMSLNVLDRKPSSLGRKFDMVLQGDNSFYSQRGCKDGYFPDKLDSQPKFTVPTDPGKKTGLGSSAAMVVAFVAATHQFYGIEDIADACRSYLSSIEFHCSCQILNAFIQNKVGSGFDIAASIYGSQIYRRFSNTQDLSDVITFLNALFNEKDAGKIVVSKADIEKYRELFGKFVQGFDFSLRSLEAQFELDMCLIDVGSGSDTRVMVKKVIEWSTEEAKREDPEAKAYDDELFKLLKGKYSELQSHIVTETQENPHAVNQMVRTLCLEIREIIREISDSSGVPIEPPK